MTTTSAQQAGIDPANLPASLATAKVPGSVNDDAKATLKLTVYGLKRSGQLLILTYSYTVESTSKETQTLYTWLGLSSPHPRLVDTAELKVHSVVKGAGTSLSTDPVGLRFGAGDTLYCFAVFAAPPDTTKTMDVLIDDAPAISALAIQ